MEQKKITRWVYSAEDYYQAAWEIMEKLEKIEAERLLSPWEEAEKEGARMDMEYYGRILEEEEEQNRQNICKSQGLSRWC